MLVLHLSAKVSKCLRARLGDAGNLGNPSSAIPARSSRAQRGRPGRPLRGAVLGAVLGGVLLLTAACSQGPDPEETRESLSEVTREPSPPEAATEYDAELHPEPIVEPRDCSPYLVITARGTDEPEDDQLLTPVAEMISEARPGEVDVMNLDYPADTEVKEGGTLGVRTLIDTLNVQTEACPEQSFVLLGYSQGALVTGDALVAPDVRLVGGTVGELLPESVDRIRAIVFYGDPRFVGGEPFNFGTDGSAVNGLLPRPLGSLDAFADRIRDYCVPEDFVCQAAIDAAELDGATDGVGLDEEGHVRYFKNGMQHDGAAFAITQLDPPAPPDPENAEEESAEEEGDEEMGDEEMGAE